ncbi:MAG: DUF1698 domain-containing protein [Planctomycetes bacterium]|nr:DUF1698 domain-containing protein [Planctomycetota bacterium]
MKIAVLVATHRRPDRLDALAEKLPIALTLDFELWAIESGSRAPGSRHAKLWCADDRGEAFMLSIAYASAKAVARPDVWVVLSSTSDLDGRFREVDVAIEKLLGEPRHGAVQLSGDVRVYRAAALDETGFVDPTRGTDAFVELGQRLVTRGFAVADGSPAAADAKAPASAERPDATTHAPRAPFGIATRAARRVFAWPDWKDQNELATLLENFGKPLVGADDACLCLRRDPRLDPSARQVLAALEAAHARVLGEATKLEVVIVDDELTEHDWPMLADAVTHVVALPSSRAGERATLYAALGRKVVHRAEQLAPQGSAAPNAPGSPGSPGAPALPQYPKEVLDQVDWRVVDEIKALHPWFFPVVLGNLKVAAGVGSHLATDFLENRAKCRKMMLVDEVVRRYDLHGKSVLELASNCGYWGARYAEHGATRVVGLEGREQCVKQAELYWRVNRFLPRGSYEFLLGNISDPAAWAEVRRRSPFDVVLCAGILYHTPNYREILRWAAEATRDALIVDSRVTDGDEAPIDEPGELYFNAIRETRRKVVPNRAKLLQALRELGFSTEVLPVGFKAQLGVQDVDDYEAGNAITVLARRVAVSHNVSSALTAPRLARTGA